jgi:hypothetical protein
MDTDHPATQDHVPSELSRPLPAPRHTSPTMLRLFHDPALSPGNSGHRQETQIRPGLTQSPGYPLNLRRLEHQSILSLNKQKNSQEQK